VLRTSTSRCLVALTATIVLSSTASAFEPSPISPRERAGAEAAGAPEARANASTQPTRRIRIKMREGPQAEAAGRPQPEALIPESGLAKPKAVRQSDGGKRQELEFDQSVSEQELARIADALKRNPAVEYAVPETIQYPQQTTDPFFDQQWDLSKQAAGIRIANAWAKSTGKDVIVAVLDTGIRPHADLAGHILRGVDLITDAARSSDGDGRDTDASDTGDWCAALGRNSSWHGTHVSGTIAAGTNNGLGVAGIARDAKILPVRVLGQCGGSSFDIADGILWAVGEQVDGVPVNPTPAKVINLSLGSRGPCDVTYQEAINKALQKGATVVVAAGNSNIDSRDFVPANCEGVVSVAATNRDGARAFFGRLDAASNFGSRVTISAPGGETYRDLSAGILSTLNDGVHAPGNDSYEAYQGTSMAAPHVSGVVALLYEIDPQITPSEVTSVLRASSQPFPAIAPQRCNTISCQCDTNICGAGILNAEAAVDVTIERMKAHLALTQGAGARMQDLPTGSSSPALPANAQPR
jgi:serine protease